MKSLIKVLVITFGIGVITVSCTERDQIVPSSKVVTIERTPDVEYSGLEIASVFDVDIQFSSTEEIIEIQANENLLGFIEVRVVNNNLIIDVKENINISGNPVLKAHIKTNNPLNFLSVSDASKLTILDPLIVDELSINLSGVSQLEGPIETKSIYIFLDDATNIILEGSSDKINVNSSGASVMSAFDFITNEATIDISGSSQVNLTINVSINLKARDASTLTYKGSGIINKIDLDEGSKVEQID